MKRLLCCIPFYQDRQWWTSKDKLFTFPGCFISQWVMLHNRHFSIGTFLLQSSSPIGQSQLCINIHTFSKAIYIPLKISIFSMCYLVINPLPFALYQLSYTNTNKPTNNSLLHPSQPNTPPPCNRGIAAWKYVHHRFCGRVCAVCIIPSVNRVLEQRRQHVHNKQLYQRLQFILSKFPPLCGRHAASLSMCGGYVGG